MTLVVDASVIAATLVDSGPDGECAATVVGGQGPVAPHHVPIEAANILPRAALAGDLSSDSASLAPSDLLAPRIDPFPYAPLADRCWRFRESITTYDAAYVVLAEDLDAPMVPLDRRLDAAPGPRCIFTTPA
jgi:predicted nucleic acid-binding protein